MTQSPKPKRKSHGKTRYHESGLRRTQLYLHASTRAALDIDNDMVLRDELGKAVSKPSDRIQSLLDVYFSVVREYMPTMPADQWLHTFDQMRQSDRRPLDVGRDIAPSVSAEPATCVAMSLADAFRRFESFDPSLLVRDRLIAAGCKLPETPTTESSDPPKEPR